MKRLIVAIIALLLGACSSESVMTSELSNIREVRLCYAFLTRAENDGALKADVFQKQERYLLNAASAMEGKSVESEYLSRDTTFKHIPEVGAVIRFIEQIGVNSFVDPTYLENEVSALVLQAGILNGAPIDRYDIVSAKAYSPWMTFWRTVLLI